MKKHMLLLGVLLCLFILAGCGGGTPKAGHIAGTASDTKTEKILRVGTDADYPPFEYFQEKTATFVGFDIDLITALAKQMGYDKVVFRDVEFNNLLPALQDKQVDVVIAAIGITDERRALADFSDPYLNSEFVVVSSFDTEFRSLGAIKGQRIAAEVGTTPASIARTFTKNLIETGTSEDALQAIVDRKADFAILDGYTAKYYIAHNYNARLTVFQTLRDEASQGLAIGVAKDNTEMLSKVNSALQDYRRSTQYEQLLKTYFGKVR